MDTLLRFMKEFFFFKCNICDTSFSQKVNVKRHIVSVHEGKKPVKCSMCTIVVLAFQTKVDKNRHIAQVCEGKMPFNCNTYEANFLNSILEKIPS